MHATHAVAYSIAACCLPAAYMLHATSSNVAYSFTATCMQRAYGIQFLQCTCSIDATCMHTCNAHTCMFCIAHAEYPQHPCQNGGLHATYMRGTGIGYVPGDLNFTGKWAATSRMAPYDLSGVCAHVCARVRVHDRGQVSPSVHIG